ncbi:MAG TPA: zinc ribbon domain-containing protein YjdM [Solimonas sp.]
MRIRLMPDIGPCPRCGLANTYPDSALFICADCGHEWSPEAADAAAGGASDTPIVKDAHGNLLANGDTVVLIKDLKVKGSSITLKGGTKIKNIRLVSGDHAVDCKIDRVSFMLEAEYLKKA